MQVSSLEAELVNVTREILYRLTLKSVLFKFKIKIKQLFDDQSASSQPSSQPVIKLPKITVPTVNGNILNWTSFWEQFEVTVHSKNNLQDVEKLVYLKDAVKNSPARHVIEGLANGWKLHGSYRLSSRVL